MLEAEVPTSVATEVFSGLLLNAKPVFRLLRDDLLDDIFFVGMTQFGGLQMQRGLKKRSSISQEPQELKILLQGLQSLAIKRRRESIAVLENSELSRKKDCGPGKLDTGRRTLRDEKNFANLNYQIMSTLIYIL